jgi:hypothetical protein
VQALIALASAGAACCAPYGILLRQYNWSKKAGASSRTPHDHAIIPFGVRRLAAALPTEAARNLPAYPFVPQGKKAAATNLYARPAEALRYSFALLIDAENLGKFGGGGGSE